MPQAANHSKGNGVFQYSPQQSRINVETRTPTAWGESRTFFEFDWSGCNNFSCQTLAQGGGDSLLPRLRYAYGTLGGFLAGQAISNFSDADADTESMEFGGALGSTGGMRIPQVRYTFAGPYGSAFSVSAENPFTAMITPFGGTGSDLATSGSGTTTSPADQYDHRRSATGLPAPARAPRGPTPACSARPPSPPPPTGRSPGGMSTSPACCCSPRSTTASIFNENFVGYGGHFAGDVHPNWFGYAKDDFLFSFVAGNGIGNYISGGDKYLVPAGDQLHRHDRVRDADQGLHRRHGGVELLAQPVSGFSTNGGYQHWWLPNLRSTIAAGDEPAIRLLAADRADPIQRGEQGAVGRLLNLVWNPVPFITTGVQYMVGKRVVVSNANGQEQVLIAKWRVAF